MVGIYARVSTQEQAQSGNSIPEQQERGTKYCEAMGWPVYDIYTDAGESGATTDRPALQRLIRDVKAHRIDRVLVYKLDRLSRSQKDTLVLIEDIFMANGADFVSVQENLDTSTALGRATIGLLAVFAQLEREQIRERMQMGMIARQKSGLWRGHKNAPIGYDYIDGKLVINEFEAMQIRLAFDLYLQGLGGEAIAKEMRQKGYAHKYGEWTMNRVYKAISNPIYIGKTQVKNVTYVGIHQPIVNFETFDAAQKMRLQRQKKWDNGDRNWKSASALGGILWCGQCGAKYSKTYYKGYWPKTSPLYGQKRYFVKYTCNSRNKRRIHRIKDINCKNKNWKIEELDNIVFGEIRKLALDKEYFQKHLKPAKDQRPVIEKQMAKIDGQIERLMELYAVEGMPMDVLHNKIDALKDKHRQLEDEIVRLEASKDDRVKQEQAYNLAKGFGAILDKGDFDEIRLVVTSLIEKVVVDGDDVKIHWKF